MRFTKTVLTIAITGLLGACMTPQDSGSGNEVSVGGVAVDGYLARARVFVDTNQNYVLDAWEPSALTDGDGYFSYNPNSQTNYCELPQSDSRTVHCLRTVEGLGEVPIIMVGGYDRITNEPFVGTLTVRADISEASATATVTGSPLTSLYDRFDAGAKATFLNNEGLTEAGLRSDFLAAVKIARDRADKADPVSSTDLPPIQLAWRLHKVVDIIASRLEANFPGVFGGTNQPADATAYVYDALAVALMADYNGGAPAADLAAFIAAGTNVEDVVAAANTAILNDFSADYPAITGIDVVNDVPNLAAWVRSFSAMVDNVFVGIGQKDDIEARARAIEVVAGLMRDTTIALAPLASLPNIQNAINLATDATYLTGLRSNQTDVADLTGQFAAPGGDTLTNLASDYSGRKTLWESLNNQAAGTGTAGDTLSGSTLNIANNDDPANPQTAELNFQPSADPNAGTLEAVIDFSAEGLDIPADPTKPITGTWEQVDDYNMVLNLDVADGVTMPVIVKTDPAGGYTFDLGGETKTWSGS